MKETSENFCRIVLSKDDKPIGIADGIRIFPSKIVEDFPVHREHFETKIFFDRMVFNDKIPDKFDVEVESWKVNVKRTFDPFSESIKEIPNTRRKVKYIDCRFKNPYSFVYFKDNMFILNDVESVCSSGL